MNTICISLYFIQNYYLHFMERIHHKFSYITVKFHLYYLKTGIVVDGYKDKKEKEIFI